MIWDRVPEAGEFNRTCSTHLYQNLSKAGIAPIWADVDDAPKGGAVFFYYDGYKTCLRLMPNTPRFFQASLRSDLLSQSSATLLSRALTRTVSKLNKSYSGYFAPEFRQGRVAQILEQAEEANDFGLNEAHTSLGPDDLYTAIPWPCIPSVHFKFGTFTPGGVRAEYFFAAAKEALRAIGIAVDVATLGPSVGIGVEATLKVLQWLESDCRDDSAFDLTILETPELRKILVPSFAAGFQGIVFGFFNRLPAALEPFVVSQLYQFAATLGEHVAAQREREYAELQKRPSERADHNASLLGLLPPVEQLLCVSGKERVGWRMNREGSYFAGYRSMERDELGSALNDPLNKPINTHEGDAGMQAYVKLSSDTDALNPLFTLLRLRQTVSRLRRSEPEAGRSLSRAELGALMHSLRRQVKETRGAIAACRKLFLLDTVLRHYEVGEVILSNRKARDYVANVLRKSVAGYHIAGKAALKFEADVHKMLPQRFTFELMSSHSIRVRWNRQMDGQSGPAEFLRN